MLDLRFGDLDNAARLFVASLHSLPNVFLNMLYWHILYISNRFTEIDWLCNPCFDVLGDTWVSAIGLFSSPHMGSF